MRQSHSKRHSRRLQCCMLFAVTALSLLPGCRRFTATNCEKPEVYAAAQSVAPLRIPAGLDAPNTRGALKIPDLNEPEAPRVKGDPCLDQPPRFSNANLEPPPKQSRSERRKAAKQAPATPAPATPAGGAAPAP